MATLTPTLLSSSGTTASLTAATACGDRFKLTLSGCFIKIHNGGGSAITVTIPNQQGGSNISVSVAHATDSTDDKLIAFSGGLDAFVDDDGYINVNYSAVTSVTVGAFILQS